MNKNYDVNLPKYTWGSKWGKKSPTAKQIEFVQLLAEKIGVTIINTDEMDRGDASVLINEMKRVADGDSMRYIRRDQTKFIVCPEEK